MVALIAQSMYFEAYCSYKTTEYGTLLWCSEQLDYLME